MKIELTLQTILTTTTSFIHDGSGNRSIASIIITYLAYEVTLFRFK